MQRFALALSRRLLQEFVFLRRGDMRRGCVHDTYSLTLCHIHIHPPSHTPSHTLTDVSDLSLSLARSLSLTHTYTHHTHTQALPPSRLPLCHIHTHRHTHPHTHTYGCFRSVSQGMRCDRQRKGRNVPGGPKLGCLPLCVCVYSVLGEA